MSTPGPDRRRIVNDLVVARAMAIATLPVDDDEPDAMSNLWLAGVAKVIVRARAARDLRARRDFLVLAGAHIVGWIEAIDAAIDYIYGPLPHIDDT